MTGFLKHQQYVCGKGRARKCLNMVCGGKKPTSVFFKKSYCIKPACFFIGNQKHLRLSTPPKPPPPSATVAMEKNPRGPRPRRLVMMLGWKSEKKRERRSSKRCRRLRKAAVFGEAKHVLFTLWLFFGGGGKRWVVGWSGSGFFLGWKDVYTILPEM